MDDSNANNANMEQPSPPPAQASTAGANAGFGVRLVAWLVDVVIIGVVTGILGRLFGVASVDTTAANIAGSVQYSNPFMLLAPIYLVIMDVKYGATIGKMALGLRVQDEATGKNLTVVQAILREVVGKFVSSIALCLGYFWIIWDPKKQGWHDKIAKSLVVKTK